MTNFVRIPLDEYNELLKEYERLKRNQLVLDINQVRKDVEDTVRAAIPAGKRYVATGLDIADIIVGFTEKYFENYLERK